VILRQAKYFWHTAAAHAKLKTVAKPQPTGSKEFQIQRLIAWHDGIA
jgi:hypothetical protein